MQSEQRRYSLICFEGLFSVSNPLIYNVLDFDFVGIGIGSPYGQA